MPTGLNRVNDLQAFHGRGFAQFPVRSDQGRRDTAPMQLRLYRQPQRVQGS
jgi:hypothetical protein